MLIGSRERIEINFGPNNFSEGVCIVLEPGINQSVVDLHNILCMILHYFFGVIHFDENSSFHKHWQNDKKFRLNFLKLTNQLLFQKSPLIRWTQKKIRDLTQGWTHIACLAVSHSNHYTRMFSVLVWECNWILILAWVILSNWFNFV